MKVVMNEPIEDWLYAINTLKEMASTRGRSDDGSSLISNEVHAVKKTHQKE